MDGTAVFIGMAGGLRKVGDTVAPVVGVELQEVRENGCHTMEAVLPDYDIVLFVHGYDDDPSAGMMFTRHPFQLAVYTGDESLRISVARDIFEKLKTLGVPLMLVDAVQTKLDEWVPFE